MVTDISATQEYHRNLLNEKPIPGYVQYFVKEPFIIHLYTIQQIELLKLLNKGIILHLDVTGSLISKILLNPAQNQSTIMHSLYNIQTTILALYQLQR